MFTIVSTIADSDAEFRYWKIRRDYCAVYRGDAMMMMMMMIVLTANHFLRSCFVVGLFGGAGRKLEFFVR